MVSIVIFARCVQYSVIVAVVEQSVFLIVSHSPVREKNPKHSSERRITCAGSYAGENFGVLLALERMSWKISAK